MKYTAIWEVVDDIFDNYGETDSNDFDTLEECIKWFGPRFNSPVYSCMVINNITHRIALSGYLI